jgi:hypothetical protein
MEKELEELKIHKNALETLFNILWKKYILLDPPDIPVRDDQRKLYQLLNIVCSQLRFVRYQNSYLLKKQ